MLVNILNHFRLTGRLFRDGRVSPWLKALLVGLPLAYAVIPFGFEIPDFVPVIGILDDLLLLGVATLIFNAACPPAVKQEHLLSLQGIFAPGLLNFESTRHPDELRNLAIGLFASSGVMLLAGMAVGWIWLLLFLFGYLATSLARGKMLANAIQCTPMQLPHLHRVLLEAQSNLPPAAINLFVTQNPALNAYTFGYREPYTIVLTSALVEKLSEREIRAVIGHELGHIYFNHVILINIMGASLTGLERLLFYHWSRSCEYSADAIALQSCGNDPMPMASALITLASGLNNASINMDEFLKQVREGGDKKAAENAELVSTHPFIHNRIRRLIELACGQSSRDQIPPSLDYFNDGRTDFETSRVNTYKQSKPVFAHQRSS